MTYGIILKNDSNFKLLGKPMISYVINNLNDIVDDLLFISDEDNNKDYHFNDLVDIIDDKGCSLIIPANMPIIDSELLKSLINYHMRNNNKITLLYSNIDKQTFKNNFITTGVICINNDFIPKIIGNIIFSNHQYFFNFYDLANKLNIGLFNTNDDKKCIRCDDYISLSYAEKELRSIINRNHMCKGVRIENPETVIIEPDVKISKNTFIGQCCKITGNSIIKDGAQITLGSEIYNSTIGENTIIRQSVIEDSIIGSNCKIGPFTHIRMNSNIEGNNRIGNFVEIKKSQIGINTTAAHLTYIGDTECKENVNFGCGSVTVNYDGVSKHKTIIGNNVFIGCNSNLIAPIEIGDNAFIAAGSTINNSIENNDFAIARAYQITKKDYMKKENKVIDNQ
ncbi:MAG: DapH/DapD/GlmU-related protein [Anaeroplasma sp.]